MQSIRQKVLEIIAEQAVLDVSDIKADATPESLGLDSLGLVEAVFAIEEQFDVSVPFNANEPGKSGFDISSVDSMISAVESLVGEKLGVAG